MYDPNTVAYEIRSPFRDKPDKLFPKGYRHSLVTIWHVDPECDGTDDSCGWFLRGRHLSAKDKKLAHDLINDEHDNIRYWFPDCDAEEAVSRVLGIFAALRRRERPWYKHPRRHFWHWRLQIHPWQTFRRWAFSRCAGCGKRFSWGYSPIRFQWDRERPKVFRSEIGSYHHECAEATKDPSYHGGVSPELPPVPHSAR